MEREKRRLVKRYNEKTNEGEKPPQERRGIDETIYDDLELLELLEQKK